MRGASFFSIEFLMVRAVFLKAFFPCP
jgi:hypothetical protein